MNFDVPVDVIRNNGYGLSSLDFIVYCLLLRSSIAKDSLDISVDIHSLKRFLKIGDNRTMKKILTSLINYKLIDITDIELKRNGYMDIRIVTIPTNDLLNVTDDTFNLVKRTSPHAFRIYLLYQTYDNSARKPTFEDINRLYKLSSNTISEAKKQLNELELLPSNFNIEDDVDIDDIVYFSTEEIKPIFKDFTEKRLENLLINNMELIEHKMIYVNNQYEIEDGRIDIIARDKEGVLCIIELKIEDDCKDIIFQCAYYPTQFKEKTRMITICPNYSNRLKAALHSLGYVEMKIYKMEKNRIIIDDYVEEIV